MPTGIHIRDARQQLFVAAQRVLLRDGPEALTSRAVTAEAGVAKGVLHRHFPDFDAFLAELVRDRVARVEDQAALLRASAGIGSVAGNVANALTELFDPLVVAIVSLVIFRDELRARLRETGPAQGIPVLVEASAMLAAYLTGERELGRIAADADTASLALSLTGAGHLLFAAGDRLDSAQPEDVGKVVTAVLADVLQRRLR
ncbi:TetR/AcrR family transcriptional regulator [Amycolatopsis saalfeldensis]|uniref:DNA-binding transcriptional regulator, AcrR family n=1 Tax=Amycolatopsis saalfeldensis TaxID=394193 RepID=A0A1H8UZJ8_9PSEU|nr:TetR/AcrR family transcriptional regulator [Amycolatopsis saalfeldensis]SEP08384.1 DNA-binding transcriptional regulator, AcrR family [Amycolatopsis saalfeldensis]